MLLKNLSPRLCESVSSLEYQEDFRRLFGGCDWDLPSVLNSAEGMYYVQSLVFYGSIDLSTMKDGLLLVLGDVNSGISKTVKKVGQYYTQLQVIQSNNGISRSLKVQEYSLIPRILPVVDFPVLPKRKRSEKTNG